MTKELKMNTEVSSQIDFKITKEDVYTVLLSEKEKEFEEQIATAEALENTLSEGLKTLSKKIEQSLVKDAGGTYDAEGNHNISNISQFVYISSVESLNKYDIYKLSSVKQPKRSKNKYSAVYVSQMKVLDTKSAGREVKLQKSYTDPQGFSGTLTKSHTLKLSAATKKLAKAYEPLDRKLADAKIATAELEYQLLLLETDKTIKANLIKKVVGTTDLKQLLLN